MTIQEFGAKLRARTVTSEAIVEECLAQIEARNPETNAFILVMADEARRQAREADREFAAGRDRGPLHGVPISIKDLMDVRGTETTAASRVRVGRVASQDAPCVAQPAGSRRRLRRQDEPARVRPRDDERRLGVRGRP